MSKPFLNPYAHPTDPLRFSSNVPRSIHDFICGIAPGQGAKQTIINILFDKLVHELNSRNITCSLNRTTFEHFIANCELVLPGDTIELALPGQDGTHFGTFVSRKPFTGALSNTTPSPLPGDATCVSPTSPSNAGKLDNLQGIRRGAKPTGKGRVTAKSRKVNRPE